jgi:hypothetical protein
MGLIDVSAAAARLWCTGILLEAGAARLNALQRWRAA